MQKYEPGKLEVAKEMTKVFAEGTKDFLKAFAKNAGVIGFFPSVMPTAMRKMNEHQGMSPLESAPEFAGKMTGIIIGGPALWLGQIFGYSQLHDNGYGEFCYISLATNAASFAYEIGRCVYKESIKNLAEKRNSLEAKVESYKNIC